MKNLYFIMAIVFSLLLSCDKDDSLTYEEQLAKDVAAIDAFLTAQNINAVKDESGLRYVVHVEGTGKSPKYNSNTPGDCFDTDYVGKLLKDHSTFDSSNGFRTSLSSPIIDGWKIGFQLLQEGDSATLYLPSGLAYKKTGFGTDIPENAILYFHVKLNKVVTPQYNPANGSYTCYYNE